MLMRTRRNFLSCPVIAAGVLAAGLASVVGCGGGPSRVAAPGWEPDAMSAEVMDMYDANSDGLLDEEEMAKAPGLAQGLERMDTSGDGKLSADELEARFQLYADMGTGMQSQSVQILLNNRPIRNAPIRFVPAPFLEGVIEGCEGVTDNVGVVTPLNKKENLRAMQNGFYRIEIDTPMLKGSKAEEAAKQLGIEISPVSEGENTGSTIVLNIKV